MEKPVIDGNKSQPTPDSGGSSTFAFEKPVTDNGALKSESPYPPQLESELLPFPNQPTADGARHTFILKTTESHKLPDVDEATFNRLKKAPNEAVQKKPISVSKRETTNSPSGFMKCSVIEIRKIRSYFYGAGDAYSYEGDNPSAFANFVTAWHLADNAETSQFKECRQRNRSEIEKSADDCFKLTYGYNSRIRKRSSMQALACGKRVLQSKVFN